jgi:Fe-S-cluster containining protein
MPPKALPPLNGVSISKIELEQNGDLHVEFDLPTPEHTTLYRTDVLARRSFDVYEDPELLAAAKKLFRVLQERMLQPDPSREGIDCMRCKESQCCREYDVFVDAEDVARLSAHLGLSQAETAARHLTTEPDWTGDYKFRLKKNKDAAGEKCVFLKRDRKTQHMRCGVYEARPNLCRSFSERDCTLFDGKKP